MSDLADPIISISWHNTLNPTFQDSRLSLTTFIKLVKEANYPYYCWNDKIYETNTNKFTGITKNEIDF